MRLLGLDIAGYRRFLHASIDLDSDPVAVIGRNEAGKSSLLQALLRLNDDEPIDRPDQTRGNTFPSGHRVLTAWFAVEDDDRALLSAIPEASGASTYQVTKSVDGTIRGGFFPHIARDRDPRHRALTLHRRVAATRWFVESDLAEEDFSSAGAILASDDETLSSEALEELEGLTAELPDEPHGSLPAQLRRSLEVLLPHERRPTPTRSAAQLLLDRRPMFVLFDEEHRDLQSVYDLAVAAGDPPAALKSIASLASLSLTDAVEAQRDGDYGRLERLERNANAELQTFFSTAWRQSSMHVQLRIDQTELRILVDNLRGDLTGIGERSAGLQTFVALVAFLAEGDYRAPPVVLIDEAETHLHYDAQADIVRVFSEQDAASKVIYTTHSAGCLPLDLGIGVRAAVTELGDISRIEDSIWEMGLGISPMLLAMGASVLAFSRARRAVIGEGASEALLLPTLLKDAVPPDEVNYQVAPGVANASREAIAELDMEAVAVGYVLDGDKGGRDHAKRLRTAGIPEERILFLGSSPTSGVTLEDLVTRDAYVTAVNEVLATWHPGHVYPASSVVSKGRAAALARWCKQRQFEPPDKKRVAARLLEMTRRRRSETPRQVTSPAGRSALRELHAEIVAALRAPAPLGDEEE